MGGGDLNMKKHFHPLTIENLERVWKAEEKKRLEEERIQQLQQELEEERQREQFQMQAVQSGLVKKKTEKLDWMYSHQQSVNHEAYLLGKKIDKNVEVLKEDEKQTLSSGTSITPSTNLPKASDILAKVKEDPLFLIKKREEDNRKDLIKNPLKMKKMKALLQQQVAEHVDKISKDKKSHKKSKKKKHRRSSSVDSDEERKHKKRERYNQHRTGNYPIRSEEHERRKKIADSNMNGTSEERHQSRPHKIDNSSDREHGRSRRNDEHSVHKSSYNNGGEYNKPHKRKRERESESDDSDARRSSRSNKNTKYYRKEKPKERRPRKNSDTSSDEEDEDALMEARRKQMLSNAKWRQSQRVENVKQEKEKLDEEEKNVNLMLSKSKSGEEKAHFIQKMQTASFHSDETSVEDRIRRNIHSKQRTKAALDKKFTSK